MESIDNPIDGVLFRSTGIDARAGSTIHQLEGTKFLGRQFRLPNTRLLKPSFECYE